MLIAELLPAQHLDQAGLPFRATGEAGQHYPLQRPARAALEKSADFRVAVADHVLAAAPRQRLPLEPRREVDQPRTKLAALHDDVVVHLVCEAAKAGRHRLLPLAAAGEALELLADPRQQSLIFLHN